MAHTLSEEELERQVGVSTLFEMSLMTTDADRWKNKPSKLTSADQARVEKALKQADLLRKLLAIEIQQLMPIQFYI